MGCRAMMMMMIIICVLLGYKTVQSFTWLTVFSLRQWRQQFLPNCIGEQEYRKPEGHNLYMKDSSLMAFSSVLCYFLYLSQMSGK
jgi:hypothetical protein